MLSVTKIVNQFSIKSPKPDVLSYIFYTLLILNHSLINIYNDQKVMDEILYTFPDESSPHEATWLQWPHHHQYGITFRDELDQTWVEITSALHTNERVNIIAYDESEKNRIIALLDINKIEQGNITYYIHKTNDVWIRDNGPIFVKNSSGKVFIQDWGFNGWGSKAAFENCNVIPSAIGKKLGIDVVDLNDIMINEGGSIEHDGRGTAMACKSSILNNNRNPGMDQKEAEAIFRKYLGITQFIWLDGQAGLEITDQHIDGFARFGNDHTIVTMERGDLIQWDVKSTDIDLLFNATNTEGLPYDYLFLPLTQHNVKTTKGKDLGYKGSYCNFYIANTAVLVPTYNDPNDRIALDRLQSIYPNRKVIGIDCRNLYANGGMIHCVTQQQPQ